MIDLELSSVRALHAPNVWARFPVLEANVQARVPAGEFSALRDRLDAMLSTVASPGELERRMGATWPGDSSAAFAASALAHTTLMLQNLCGQKVAFAGCRPGRDGSAKSLVEYEDEGLVRPCFAVAESVCLAAAKSESYNLPVELLRLRDIADRICLGPSTRAIVGAAVKRSIPYRRLHEGSIVQLGHGIHQRRIWAAETDRTSAIGETIASNKELSKRLLRAVGLPVPEGLLVRSEDEAWKAAGEIGPPVVVKPVDGNHGRSVFIGLTAKEEVQSAYLKAKEEGGGVLVERCLNGNEHRLLVIDGQLAAATRGDALYVTGDGVRTVDELVDELNSDPRRGQEDDCPLNIIDFDSPTLYALAHHGFTRQSVPGAGQPVLISRNGNLSTDVTDIVHPLNAEVAVLAARTVGLDIAGIDIVVEDISQPITGQKGAIVEVNAGPGLQMHLQPAAGTPRPVGEKIIAMLFPEGSDGRIPLVAVLGSASLTREIARELEQAGLQTGVACQDGIFLNGSLTVTADATSHERVAGLLMHPFVAAVVVQVTPEAVRSEGLAFDVAHAVAEDSACVFDEDIRSTVTGTLTDASRLFTAAAGDLPGLVAAALFPARP